MNNFFQKIKPIFFILVLTIFAVSCSNKIGYGVVNWSIPEYNLTAGDIIPVYVRSNIEKVYIVGLNEKTSVRVEIPLWQLSFFESKKQAVKFQSKLAEQKHNYAKVKLDGLPMRSDPDNNSAPVYRLKEGQIVKILWLGEGVPVLKGGKPMDGQWYRVLTGDGIKGWCFSYNLAIYDETNKETSENANLAQETDAELEAILSEFWYPENYRKMINNRQIDLDKMSLTWGFFPGLRSGIARVELENTKISFPYTRVIKTGNKYNFEGSNLSMQIRGKDIITIEFSDKNGKHRLENFITLNATPEDIINKEIKRREMLIDKIAKTSSEFKSENFGSLKIMSDGQFIWSGYTLISPSIIPSGAGSSGKVSIKNFLDKKLSTDYQGALSFRFEKTAEPVVFMYSISSKGLRLEAVEPSGIKDNIVMRRSLNPVILFFSAD
ncbi:MULTISPECIES: SH3 domain-containing protein [unclassified Treponema]|uniref:SH3 domain-containing protein n=1 Tax=unclassified Treponema TaxID=2638727 RepID=UPI0020A57575|nr:MULTISPECIES: SH3 domain-containing protein [unclassified Treponema]UTC68245.1 SH3 domain-containing protein [Treponema sp. OMZ 789]UTC70965.1 SH3 domain-containing protein [Treponema sp. OMZ 790]UTC73705.1 SH3 domain-containing protein [Treponema sp. OMZ 791]